MLNILIPMAGAAQFDQEEFQYPKPLIEIEGKPLIERVIACFQRIKADKRYIFVVNALDCQVHHLDDVLGLVTGGCCEILPLEKPTAGAACSALMAVDSINCDDPLIISNCDHIFDINLNDVMESFSTRQLDGGVISFDSVHPKWSFVRLDDTGRIIETSEKRPLSRHAIAGFYYYRRGSDFVRAAMKMIEKDVSVDGRYFIAPTFNELILEDLHFETYAIPGRSYHNLYSPHKIREYEGLVRQAH